MPLSHRSPNGTLRINYNAWPLLLWHGQEDDVVPAVETFRLQQALIQAGLDNNLTCLWEAGVRHRITPEALAATVTFFRQHL